MTRFSSIILPFLLVTAAVADDAADASYHQLSEGESAVDTTTCRPACLSLFGFDLTVPVNARPLPTGGVHAYTQYAHRASLEDMGSFTQRVPSLVYKLPNATAKGGPVFVDLTSAITVPTALLYRHAIINHPGGWLRLPAELLAIPNSLYAMHFGDHPLGYAFGLSTSLYAGSDGLKPVSTARLGVLFGLPYARWTMGVEQRFWAPKSLGIPEFSYLLQVDLWPRSR